MEWEYGVNNFAISTIQPQSNQNNYSVSLQAKQIYLNSYQQTVDHIKTRMYQPLLSCVSSRDGGASPSQIGKWLLLRLLNAVRSQFSQLFFHGLHWKGTINNLHKHKSWVRFADSFDNRFHKHKIYLGSFYFTHIKLAILAFRNRSQEVEENIACHSGPLSSWVDTQN